MKKNTLFIISAFNFEISSPLGKGVEIKDGIFLTNDSGFIDSLLDDYLHESIGNLEFRAIQNGKAIFYKISIENINSNNHDQLLTDFLSACQLFTLDLWIQKDHAIDMMLGFTYYPYLVSKVIDTRNIPEAIHSNMVTGSSTLATGEYKTTSFSKEDISAAVSIAKRNTYFPLSESATKKTLITKEHGRFSVSMIFIQAARNSHDLGLKIAHLCSSFETLFSTDSQELSHKLAERIAWFLEPLEFSVRLNVYRDVKLLYNIRSQVVHGSQLGTKTLVKLGELSVLADDIARRVVKRLSQDDDLINFFSIVENEKMEAYFIEMCLGRDIMQIPISIPSL